MKELMMCPKCKGNLNDELVCLKCSAKYEYQYGVYNVLFEKLTDEYQLSGWDINENDIEESNKKYEEFQKEYKSSLNQESQDAWKKQSEFVIEKIKEMKGTVLDIATGRGMFLKDILSCHNNYIDIIGSDIDARILAVTRETRHTGDKVAYIGMDARHMALKDKSVDNVVSFVGLINMPDTE